MELILISKSKLKIMLSADDMKTYNIECDGESAFRRGFRPVLEKARRDCGFETEGGRLLVQVFPSRTGGCEMFITRVSPEKDVSAVHKKDRCTVIFRSAGALVSACGLLWERGYCGESSAFSFESGTCALMIDEPDPSAELSVWAAVEEYGEKRMDKELVAYLKEHGRPIIMGNAVERLAVFC